MSDRPTPASVFGDVKGGSGKCARCGKHVANVSFHQSRCADEKLAPTTETDAAQFGTGRVSVDFARRLERERDTWRLNAEVNANTSYQLAKERDEARAEAAQWQEVANRHCTDAAKLNAECEQLREALGKIADLCQLTCVTFEQQSFRATRIAREALAAKEGA